VFLADPVADEAYTVLAPAPDVPCNLAIEEDRLHDRRRVAEDVCRPMSVEGCAIACGEGGHARGVAVELLLVEDREVVGLDVAESYLVAHLPTPTEACRSISRFALSTAPRKKVLVRDIVRVDDDVLLETLKWTMYRTKMVIELRPAGCDRVRAEAE
jgi:hypothetical protein